MDVPKILSVDDHVVEPPHVWQTWLPAKLREAGPRVERRRWGQFVHHPGAKYTNPDDDVSRFDPTVMTLTAVTYDEMRPGCYDRDARIEDFELNWVDGSLPFPTFPRFCGQTFMEGSDLDLGLAC